MERVGNAVVVVLSTAPDVATAQRLANALVERRLAACVQVIPGILSTYRWKGDVQRDDEVLLLVKTTRAGAEAVQGAIAQLHPYEVPEVVVLPVEGGGEAYLRWVAENVGG